MCIVSIVTDDYLKKWPQQNNPYWADNFKTVTREEFDRLKKEFEKFKREAKQARQQDIAENNEDCEMAQKIEIVKKIANSLGVDLEDIFEGHK